MRNPSITHDGPISGLIPYWIGRIWMGLFGWNVVGQIPAGGRFVLIGAPHTSGWDFPFTLAAVYVFRLKISWMGKRSLFKKPFGIILKWLGGIAIDRESNHGVVDHMAQRFKESKTLVVAVAPSGTRKKRDYWKSGFYRIAHAAQVPILCGFLDYDRKRAGLGLSFVPTGNVSEDMDRIRAFYAGIQGKHPELATTVRLLDEAG
jgi:1-acyl-sn-glycerol-3-phosphate acyltransferase